MMVVKRPFSGSKFAVFHTYFLLKVISVRKGCLICHLVCYLGKVSESVKLVTTLIKIRHRYPLSPKRKRGVHFISHAPLSSVLVTKRSKVVSWHGTLKNDPLK